MAEQERLIRCRSMLSMRLQDENGFTLVEIITVVVIIGIMAVIAVPNFFSWLPNMRLKAAASDLYSNFQKARMMAVKSNRETAIIFDTANNKYEICDDWDNAATSCVGAKQTIDFSTLKSGIGYGHGLASHQANAAGTAFPLSPDDDVSYSSPDNVVTFTSRGLSNDGYVYLDHTEKTTTYAVGSRSSGVIKLLKWKGSKWE